MARYCKESIASCCCCIVCTHNHAHLNPSSYKPCSFWRLSNQISGRASFPPIMVCVVCFYCIHLIKEPVKQCRGSSSQSLHGGTAASPSKLSYGDREIISGGRPPQQVLPMEWILVQGSFASLNPLTHTSWKNVCATWFPEVTRHVLKKYFLYCYILGTFTVSCLASLWIIVWIYKSSIIRLS